MNTSGLSDASEGGFPWADVDASRCDEGLQREHCLTDAQVSYLAHAKCCRECGTNPEKLAWFYFESPSCTWESECGRAGWMIVCDRCHLQVDFFLEIMS